MRRSKPTARKAPPKPADYDGWLADLTWIADTEGLALFVMAWMHAPQSCCQFLESRPGELERLIARARWADRCVEICGQHRRVS